MNSSSLFLGLDVNYIVQLDITLKFDNKVDNHTVNVAKDKIYTIKYLRNSELYEITGKLKSININANSMPSYSTPGYPNITLLQQRPFEPYTFILNVDSSVDYESEVVNIRSSEIRDIIEVLPDPEPPVEPPEEPVSPIEDPIE